MSDQKEDYSEKDDSYESAYNMENYSIEELIENNSNKIESNSIIIGMLDERADENERKIKWTYLQMLVNKLGDMYKRINTSVWENTQIQMKNYLPTQKKILAMINFK